VHVSFHARLLAGGDAFGASWRCVILTACWRHGRAAIKLTMDSNQFQATRIATTLNLVDTVSLTSLEQCRDHIRDSDVLIEATDTPPATMASSLDAHAKPPDSIRQVYKHFQKLDPRAADQDGGMIDTRLLHDKHPHVSSTSLLELPANIKETFVDFVGHQMPATESAKVYSVNTIPGKSANLNIGSEAMI